jgi:hypothetical protein
MQDDIPRRAAPWRLSGNAFLLFYRFNESFLSQSGSLPEALQGRYKGGPGAILLVDYTQSNAGPYQELLFIPGRFQLGRSEGYSVTRIYVSTQISAANGRLNWGLDKRLAHFESEEQDRQKTVRVFAGQRLIVEAVLERGRIPFPVWIDVLPARLLQALDGEVYLTRIRGKGKGSLARLKALRVNGRLFPDVTLLRPLAAFAFTDFQLLFPQAKKTQG